MPIHEDDVREHADAIGSKPPSEEEAERIADLATDAAREVMTRELKDSRRFVDGDRVLVRAEDSSGQWEFVARWIGGELRWLHEDSGVSLSVHGLERQFPAHTGWEIDYC